MEILPQQPSMHLKRN